MVATLLELLMQQQPTFSTKSLLLELLRPFPVSRRTLEYDWVPAYINHSVEEVPLGAECIPCCRCRPVLMKSRLPIDVRRYVVFAYRSY
jgi:hypothetical protein